MAKKKAVNKVKRRRRPVKENTTRPVFGFWYNRDEQGPLNIILKDCNMKHIIEDECEEGEWYP